MKRQEHSPAYVLQVKRQWRVVVPVRGKLTPRICATEFSSRASAEAWLRSDEGGAHGGCLPKSLVSNQDALDLIEADLVVPTVIKLGGAGRGPARNYGGEGSGRLSVMVAASGWLIARSINSPELPQQSLSQMRQRHHS